MKRHNNIYQQICSIPNLLLADSKARIGKQNQYGVQLFDKHWQDNILELHYMLKNKTYKTSAYKTFPIWEPKERLVFCLPYWPDRICHHAIMNPLESIFVNTFTADTYSCIKGRGIHGISYKLRDYLKDAPATQYCLQMDVKKFYLNINHDILKNLLRKKFKDRNLLWLLDEIIDSAEGVPIGNYLSQYFANFYLTYLDHWIKEVLREKMYLRYADDMVIPHASKQHLHQTLARIREYLWTNLKLEIKANYQIYKVAADRYSVGRGINLAGYVHFHDVTYLRKEIKENCARKMAKTRTVDPAYNGWIMHCDGKHLLKKLTYEYCAAA